MGTMDTGAVYSSGGAVLAWDHPWPRGYPKMAPFFTLFGTPGGPRKWTIFSGSPDIVGQPPHPARAAGAGEGLIYTHRRTLPMGTTMGLGSDLAEIWWPGARFGTPPFLHT